MPSLQANAIAFLVSIMLLSVGLRVTVSDVLAVRRTSRELAWVLVINVLLIPAVAMGLCAGMATTPAVTMAMLLCAAAPGGPMGPLLAGMAGAHLGFAVAVMVLLAMLSVFTTPVTLWLILPGDLAGTAVSPVAIAATLAKFQLAPLVVGMAIRRRLPRVAAHLAPPVTRLANGLLVAVVVVLAVSKGHMLGTVGGLGLLVMMTLVLACLLLGGAGQSQPITRAAALCTGVRNLALALLLVATHFPDPKTDAAVLSFGLLMLGTPLALVAWWRRKAGVARGAGATVLAARYEPQWQRRRSRRAALVPDVEHRSPSPGGANGRRNHAALR